MPMIFRCDTCGSDQTADQFETSEDFYVECEGCGQDCCTLCINRLGDDSMCNQCAAQRASDESKDLQEREG